MPNKMKTTVKQYLSVIGCMTIVLGVVSSCFLRNIEDARVTEKEPLLEKLAEVQSEARFTIVFPGYLPPDFRLEGVSGFPRFGARLSFVNEAKGGVRDNITILQGADPSFFESRKAYPENAVKEVKGVEVFVLDGSTGYSGLKVDSSGAKEQVPAVWASWSYQGIFFDLMAVGLAWDGVEPIIASMME